MLHTSFIFRTAELAAAAAASATAAIASSTAPQVRKQHFAQQGLDGLRIAVYMPPGSDDAAQHSGSVAGTKNQALAVGHVISQLSETVFAVNFTDSCLAPFIEVGSRVYITYDADVEGAQTGFLVDGLIVKVNPNGTFGVLLGNGKLDLAVPREKIALSEGKCRFMDSPQFEKVVEWVRSAGLDSVEDQVSTACVLYYNGWRADRLYLLEASDVSAMLHLNKPSRMALMEKGEWQRDHHRQMRSIYRERVKEKDKRYLFAKYAGILSATVAFCGAFSLFGWNYKNYLKQQRSYQMTFAVKALCRKAPTKLPVDSAKAVPRDAEERWIRQILRQLDTAHPRIVVLTGYSGCGKSTVCRAALAREGKHTVFVDVRSREEMLKSIVKALGVPNVEACGDPLDFIAEACKKATESMHGRTPIMVLKMREGDNLTRVYNDAIALACDRRVCHLVMEVPVESLTMSNVSLPRLDFYTVPNFTAPQAFQYTQNTIDPVSLVQFIETVGTNSNDLDELFAAVQQRGVTAAEYTNQKLLKAMRQLQSVWNDAPHTKRAVQCLSQFAYTEGQHSGVDELSLQDPALKDVVIYNPVLDVWLFSSQILHSAARCCL